MKLSQSKFLIILFLCFLTFGGIGRSEARNLRIAVYGDSHVGKGDDWIHEKIIAMINAQSFDLVLHLGDFGHFPNTKRNQKQIKHFLKLINSNLKFYRVQGEHDPYLQKNYAFHPLAKNIFLFLLDTQENLSADSPQYRFLKSKLEQLKSSDIILIASHKNLMFKKEIVSLLKKHQVDLVLFGHKHNYIRYEPMHGIHYIGSGASGASLEPTRNFKGVKFFKKIHHYLSLDIGATAIHLKMINTQGVVEDELRLKLNQ